MVVGYQYKEGGVGVKLNEKLLLTGRTTFVCEMNFVWVCMKVAYM
jgi:hypothetical protein